MIMGKNNSPTNETNSEMRTICPETIKYTEIFWQMMMNANFLKFTAGLFCSFVFLTIYDAVV